MFLYIYSVSGERREAEGGLYFLIKFTMWFEQKES